MIAIKRRLAWNFVIAYMLKARRSTLALTGIIRPLQIHYAMSKKTNDFYNRFSIFYPVVELFLRPQKLQMFEEINGQKPGSLLEIGIGNGKHLSMYKKHQVTGIDSSIGMLEIARAHNKQQALLLLMDGQELNFEANSFDYVVLSHVIAVVDKPEQLLRETYRILKPGGKIFILNHFTPGNWLKYVDHAFAWFSKAFHFRSVFYMNQLLGLKQFEQVKEISFRLSYFKLIILTKV